MVSVGVALRKRGERGRGGFQGLVPFVDDVEVGLCSGGGEYVDDFLENRADGFGRHGVCRRGVAELCNEVG